MQNREEIEKLRERVRAAGGADRMLDVAILNHLSPLAGDGLWVVDAKEPNEWTAPDLTGNLDDAMEFAGAKLPGWHAVSHWTFGGGEPGGGEWCCGFYDQCVDRDEAERLKRAGTPVIWTGSTRRFPSLNLAILDAVLTALLSGSEA